MSDLWPKLLRLSPCGTIPSVFQVRITARWRANLYTSISSRHCYPFQKFPSVVVDTDSEPVTEGLRLDFPQVVILPRPEYLRDDAISMNEILLYDTSKVPADFYLQTHSTNPLLRPVTISKAVQTFLADYPTHDSLFSVTRLHTRLYDQHGHALNHDPNILLQTQNLPPVYEENSCIYIFSREKLVQRCNRLGERPVMFEMGADEAWDIDEELDFAITDFLMQNRLH